MFGQFVIEIVSARSTGRVRRPSGDDGVAVDDDAVVRLAVHGRPVPRRWPSAEVWCRTGQPAQPAPPTPAQPGHRGRPTRPGATAGASPRLVTAIPRIFLSVFSNTALPTMTL